MTATPVFPRSRPRVDAHVHLTQWWPEVGRTGYRSDLDYTAPGLLAEMDRNQIDYALVIQMFLAPSEIEALSEGQSNFVLSQGRLLPVATVDPTKGPQHVAATLARLEKAEPLFGIKLYPGYLPFYPTDARLDPVYELAHRRNFPVLVHQGDTLEGRGLLKFAQPIHLDEVAARFRDVRFVLCHLGNPWINEAAELVGKNPNVYTDTSGLLPAPKTPYFEAAVQQAREQIQVAITASGAPERFLYGSDWPLTGMETAVDLIESLRLRAEDVAKILGANAVQLFRIGAIPRGTKA